jgi:uncharacterized protein YqfA (UPF0365 family)
MPIDPVSFLAGACFGVVLLLLPAPLLLFLRPWLRAFLSGAHVSLTQVIGMRLRGTPVDLLIDAYVTLVHSDFPEMTMHEVESQFLANKGRIMTSTDLVEAVRRGHGEFQSRLDKGLSLGQNT